MNGTWHFWVTGKSLVVMAFCIYIWTTVMGGLILNWILKADIILGMAVTGMIVFLSFAMSLLFVILLLVFFVKRD